MGKRLLKFISIQMTLVMLFSMTALADSTITGEGTATGTSPSNFSVDEDVIGSGATVVIPASLPLTYNESTDSYQVASSVGVYGDMQEHMSVRVSTPSIALYRQDGAITSGYRSMSIPAPEVEDEEYQYTYALKWNEFWNPGYGQPNRVVKYSYSLKSKVQLFWSQDTTTNSRCIYYVPYVYKNGNYAKLTTFCADMDTDVAGSTIGAGFVSQATSLSEKGDVVITNVAKNVYLSEDGTFVESGDSCDCRPKVEARGSSYNVANANLGVDDIVYFSGMVFDNAINGLAWMSAHDGVDAEALENEDTIAGHVRFGDIKDGICSAGWSSAEMAEGLADDHANMKRVPLIITVASHNIEDVGDYEANIEFTIQSACIGMYSDVKTPDVLGATSNPLKQNNSSGGLYWYIGGTVTGEAYNWSKIAVEENISMRGTQLNRSYNSYETDTARFASIKYIQINTSPNLKYNIKINLNDVKNTNTAFIGCKNLKVLAVDSAFNVADNIVYDTQTGGAAYSQGWSFYDTARPVGNAVVFVKDITDDGYFVYVPHIAYRGTMAQWRAASGASDWIFGNAYNTVTVHCTDGTIEY